MKEYQVKGMSCAACVARVEKAVQKLEGVDEVSVNLLTHSMTLEGDVADEVVVAAVEKAGYQAKPYGKKKLDEAQSASGQEEQNHQEDSLEHMYEKEAKEIRNRFFVSLLLLLPFMYLSMGCMMWGWPAPFGLGENHVSMGIVQLLFALCIMWINKKFYINGFKGALHGTPNMDTLVALGSGASFVMSLGGLFLLSDAMYHHNHEQMEKAMDFFYFESAAMIVTLISLGKWLEAVSKGKTTSALRSLLALAPKTASVIRNGEECIVPVEQVRIGDQFYVRPGQQIPVDGKILEGYGAVEESVLTGESVPVDKEEGDLLYAATINQSGSFLCEAIKVGENTSFAKIIQLVKDVSSTKAPIAKIADRVSGIFVPAVLILSILTIFVWLFLGESFVFALTRGISVLVISCPCALGLATPVAIMVGSGKGAKEGILFKTATVLEEAGKTKIVILDKTGTITTGTPKVTDVAAINGFQREKLLEIAASLEKLSEHPLGKAVVSFAQQEKIEANQKVEHFKSYPGNGIEGWIDGGLYTAGSIGWMQRQGLDIPQIVTIGNEMSKEGKTPLVFCKDKQCIGLIGIQDSLREDSKEGVRQLKELGVKVLILTGDRRESALPVLEATQADELIAEVLPEEKEQVVAKWQSIGKVMMVGDGINDAPALARADVGVAIGNGTDVAIETADMVLMKNSILDVAAGIRLSRATLKNIKENLFWAFFYNAIGIPLAAGVFISTLGISLQPMFAAAAMSLSSFCVVTNALRLNLYHPKVPYETDKKEVQQEKKNYKTVNEANQKEERSTNMTKEFKVTGMMCPHCEARVKEVLEQLEGVLEAKPSHVEEKVVITVKEGETLEDSLVKETIEKAGYQVIS